MQQPDYHRFETQYRNSLMRCYKQKQPEGNPAEIEAFLKDVKCDGVGYARLKKLCQMLSLISRDLGKPFGKVREADVKRVVLKYEERGYVFWTREPAVLLSLFVHSNHL